jgi:hypothetical protein
MQKSRQGEPLTAEEQAYLHRARELRGHGGVRREATAAKGQVRCAPPRRRNGTWSTVT